MKWRKMGAVVLSGVMMTAGFVLPPQQQRTAIAANDAGIAAFDLSDVTMTDAYCVNAFEKEIAYLLSFDNNRLLAGFRDNAGMNTYGASRYEGWENSLIGGHTVGHYLTAIAQAYSNPLASDAQKQEILGKIKALVDGMAECQRNSKGKPGFLWAAQIRDRNNIEVQFDNIERGKSNIITEAWVPWYTMHKLIAGLNDVYLHTGYENAKNVGSALGDWCYNRASKWSDATHNQVLAIEYGGMNDCLYELYAITGKETHAIAAHYFDETALHEKVLKGGTDVLNGRHANTTIPKFLGALKRYMVLDGKTIGGQTVDASRYLQYAEAFWEMVRTHHTYITGGNSEWEHFGKDDILDAERTNCNCETCNSYNMLKLSRALFQITGDVKYMDFYENTYYNSILSSQNPETGMTTYFQPMATGYFKVYSTPFKNFWCCTGSGMENFTKLGDTMYMHRGNVLYVNYYQSSVLNWNDQNVTVTQESSVPDGETVKFTVSGSGDLEFRFRQPDWLAGDMTVKLNGSKYSYKTVDGYTVVSGSFSTGDVIELTLPMAVKAYVLPDNPNSYAFKYGPVVLSAELGTANMKQGQTGMNVAIPADQVVGNQKITLNAESGSLKNYMFKINDYLVKDANSLKFTLTGADQKLTFTPHYRQYQQRYGIYWYFYANGNAIEEELPRAEYAVVDTVQPGYGQYENDELHAMDETNTVSITDDSTYRYAKAGGSFTYRMAVNPDAPLTVLQVTFRKSDNGKPIRITAGNRVLYQGELNYSGKEDTYKVNLIIPQDVLDENVQHVTANDAEHDVISIGFSAGTDGESAKVCDFIYTTSVKPLYDIDSKLAYFVDCGDHDNTTASGSDKFGYYNALTEQLFGEDKVTGAEWGVIDDPTDQYNGKSKSRGLYTANTWCDEYNTTDGRDKTASFRYTKNQYENNIARHLDYGFTLRDGTYRIEAGFADPWSCSNHPTLTAEDGTGKKTVIASEQDLGTSRTVSGEVTVRGGKLTLHFTSDDKAINTTYIKIYFGDVEPLPLAELAGDVNMDGKVDRADVLMLQKFLLSGSDVTNWKAGDLDGNGRLNAIDLTLLKRTIL
ncbi:MAG TPA: hypothetical protein DDX71_08025 [Ruminococcus sp.]|nr:hypothetical protein [Ruminococcus sp.]